MKAPQRIAYLTSVYPRATDTFIRTEVEGLRELGFEVQTFSLRRPPADQLINEALRAAAAETSYLLTPAGLSRALAALFVAAVRKPRRLIGAAHASWRSAPPGLAGRVRAVAWLLQALTLARALDAAGISHLHNHMGDAPAAVAMAASELSGIPWSTTIHGMEFFRAGEIALGEKLSRAAFTACISQHCRAQCMIFTPSEHWPRLEVIRCGIGPQFLDAKPAPQPARPRLVCVGRLSPEKGVMLLVDAAARLVERGRDFDLVLLGDGPSRPAIEARIRETFLEDHVSLPGWVDSDRVAEEIAAASALVVPSFSEGIPVALMEAMALGRPAVSTRVGGIPELLEHGESGWLVAPGSVDALVEGLEALLDASPEARAAMGERGAQRVRSLHDARTQVGRLAERFRASVADGAPV